MYGMEVEAVVIECGRLVHVIGTYEIGRITAVEKCESITSVAVECVDGVRWYTAQDILTSKQAAETRASGVAKDSGTIRVVSTRGIEGYLEDVQ